MPPFEPAIVLSWNAKERMGHFVTYAASVSLATAIVQKPSPPLIEPDGK
jgi:hypothetical protein